MSKQIVIFLFHRDLRLEDNVPLQEALDYAEKYDSVVFEKSYLILKFIFLFYSKKIKKCENHTIYLI